jgi:PBSX family phage terminase large subunit
MRKKLTLLEQALIEERKEKFLQSKKLTGKSLLISLNTLLPNYKPNDNQKAFHNSQAREKGLKGGYGSGKTYAYAAEAIHMAFINRPHPVLSVSQSFDNAVDTVVEKLMLLCDENNIEYDWVESKGLFRLVFGTSQKDIARIWIRGSDKPKYLKGPTVAAAGMDEPFVQSSEAHDVVISRIREPRAARQQFFWSGTPEPETMEWGEEYFEKDSNTKDLFTTTLSTYDNTYLPKAFIRDLENKFDAATREVYMKGKYRILTGTKLYHRFDDNCKAESLSIDMGFSELILSFDFNVDPMCAVLIGLKGLVYTEIKDFKVHNSNTAEVAQLAAVYINSYIDKYNFGKSIIITGDASGKRRDTRSAQSDYDIIRDLFLDCNIPYCFCLPTENPAVRDRVNYVNKQFEKGCFLISTECKESIKDRELVIWKKGADGFFVDKSKGDRTHLSDAGDYALWNTKPLLYSAEGEEAFGTAQRPSRY